MKIKEILVYLISAVFIITLLAVLVWANIALWAALPAIATILKIIIVVVVNTSVFLPVLIYGGMIIGGIVSFLFSLLDKE
jgi:hypothetical protein